MLVTANAYSDVQRARHHRPKGFPCFLSRRQPYEVGTTVTSISRLAQGSPESELEVAGLGLESRMFDPKVCTLSLFLEMPVGRS